MKDKKILVHTCCAPCLCYTHKKLQEEGYEATAFYSNPNIHPEEEFQKRTEALRAYERATGLSVIINGTYGLADWLSRTERGWKAGKKERCLLCYEMRLRETAREARKRSFPLFTTTLLYSIHQMHDAVAKLAQQLGREEGAEFVYLDLRKGWNEGIRISREMGLYRQKYCGCIFSESER